MEQRVSVLLENRSRISQDLHDCVLQSLYAIGLHLEISCRTAPSRTPDFERSHRLIVDQINQLIHAVRQMVHGLNQDTVPEFDLAEELRTMQATYEHIGLVRITLDLEPAAIEVLTKEEEREILNIVREALSNCFRHAHAAHAQIAIRKRGNTIQVTVCDDGTGFATAVGSVKRGYGLANMEARARKIGGTLQVRSKPGHGTNITAEFSLEPMLAPV
jgi:signal transduction histidine kinase